jgi:hypothetical protein
MGIESSQDNTPATFIVNFVFMYKVLGADGKEYGPIGLEQLREWVRLGRVVPESRVQEQPAGAGSTSAEWKRAADIPELQEVFAQLRGHSSPAGAGPAGTPPPLPGAGPASGAASGLEQKKGLAITSLVLGILSVVCLGPITGIPAIICGHIAHNRARRSPTQFGGAGLAIAGFATGYVGLVLGLFMIAFYAAMLFPALSKAKGRAQEIQCQNNLKQIGVAFKVWALDHEDAFPFNVQTNAGGTLEWCQRGPDGFDRNSALHFLVLSNELGMPRILVCPSDTSKQAAMDWQFVGSSNVTYLVRTGPSVTDTNPQQVLAICPIHQHKLLVDGSVHRGGR